MPFLDILFPILRGCGYDLGDDSASGKSLRTWDPWSGKILCVVF